MSYACNGLVEDTSPGQQADLMPEVIVKATGLNDSMFYSTRDLSPLPSNYGLLLAW